MQCFFGITSTWPSTSFAKSIKARVSASSYTRMPWISPEAILQKIQSLILIIPLCFYLQIPLSVRMQRRQLVYVVGFIVDLKGCFHVPGQLDQGAGLEHGGQ